MAGRHYYDRERRRCLVLDGEATPPISYLAPVSKFGLPAPDDPYPLIQPVSLNQAGNPSAKSQVEAMLAWMYCDKEAKPADLDSVVFALDEELELGAHMAIDSPRRHSESNSSGYSSNSRSPSRPRSLPSYSPVRSIQPRIFEPNFCQIFAGKHFLVDPRPRFAPT